MLRGLTSRCQDATSATRAVPGVALMKQLARDPLRARTEARDRLARAAPRRPKGANLVLNPGWAARRASTRSVASISHAPSALPASSRHAKIAEGSPRNEKKSDVVLKQ